MFGGRNLEGSNKLRFLSSNCVGRNLCGVRFGDDFRLLNDFKSFALEIIVLF